MKYERYGTKSDTPFQFDLSSDNSSWTDANLNL